MRLLPWLLAGFGLYWLSRVVQRLGDAYPLVEDGVSWDRLTFHGLALVLLLGGLVCFLRAGVLAFRMIRGGRPGSSSAALTDDGSGPDGAPEFDPDAALARYLARKGAEETAPEPGITRPNPPAGGFGRRGL